MRLFVFSLLLALLIISQLNTIIDIDLWWNLKTGEYILKNFSIPHKDIFSYTLQDSIWIDHEWLSQIIFYLIFSRFGWPGLNIFKAIIVALSFFMLLYFILNAYRRISFALFFILLGILGFNYRSVLRPELFSYLFFCIYLLVLEKNRYLYILPILQAIWVNLHGYFIAGILLIFIYLLGRLFYSEKREAKDLTIVLIAAGFVCFINPYFYKGALYPFEILIETFTKQRIYMGNIVELKMPIQASFWRYGFFWILAILSGLTFLVNLRKGRLQHILLFAISFVASYIANRNIPFFIYPAILFSSINLNERDLFGRRFERNFFSISPLIIAGLIYLFLSNKYYIFTNQYGLRKTESRFSEVWMPSGACDFLERNNIQGRMFNTSDFGPYIAYRFYPQRRIFIDTRTDFYKDGHYLDYKLAQIYPTVWKQICDRYDFSIVLLRHAFTGTERLIKYLYKSKDWVLVYYDRYACIFLKDEPENKVFIERFEIDLDRKVLLDSDIDINIAAFFDKIGKTGLSEQIYLRLLEKDPDFLAAGNNLASIYIDTGRYDEALKLLNKFLNNYPGSPQLYVNIGIVYWHLGDIERALEFFRKSLRLDPYLRKAVYMLGIVYLKKGDLEKAEKQFVKYTILDPYDPEGHRVLGDIYKEKGLLEKANLEYLKAARLEGVIK